MWICINILKDFREALNWPNCHWKNCCDAIPIKLLFSLHLYSLFFPPSRWRYFPMCRVKKPPDLCLIVSPVFRFIESTLPELKLMICGSIVQYENVLWLYWAVFLNSIFHSAVHILSHVADKLLQWCQPNNKQLFFRLHSFQWIYSLPLTRRKNVGSAYDFRCHQRLSHVLCHFVLLYSPLMRLLLQVSTCVCILYYIHPFLAFNRSFSSLSPCKCIHIFAHFHPIKISSTL